MGVVTVAVIVVAVAVVAGGSRCGFEFDLILGL